MKTSTIVLLVGGVAGATGIGYLIYRSRKQKLVAQATANLLAGTANIAEQAKRQAAAQAASGSSGVLGTIGSGVKQVTGLAGDLRKLTSIFG